jgi:hypothetical protein
VVGASETLDFGALAERIDRMTRALNRPTPPRQAIAMVLRDTPSGLIALAAAYAPAAFASCSTARKRANGRKPRRHGQIRTLRDPERSATIAAALHPRLL